MSVALVVILLISIMSLAAVLLGLYVIVTGLVRLLSDVLHSASRRHEREARVPAKG